MTSRFVSRRLGLAADGRTRVDRVADQTHDLEKVVELGGCQWPDEPLLQQLEVAGEHLVEPLSTGGSDHRVRAAAVARAGLAAEQALALHPVDHAGHAA